MYPNSTISEIDGISFTDKDKKYWFNIRKSNTESDCIRINVENFKNEGLKNMVEKLQQVIYEN